MWGCSGKGHGIKVFPIVPMEQGEGRECRALGNDCPSPADLAAAPVGLPLEEEVVELALFVARGRALVLVELLIAQRLESLSLASRLLKNSLLLVAKILQPDQFPLKVGTLANQRGVAVHRKA